VHKLECESTRRSRDRALADHKARGGREQNYSQQRRDVSSWIGEVPGLENELNLLAWAHRDEYPFILVTLDSNSGVRVEMTPRSFWDEDPRFFDTRPETMREESRQLFSAATCNPSKQYMCIATKLGVSMISICFFVEIVIRGTEVAEALTAATNAEDLAGAFAWFESAYPSNEVHRVLQRIRQQSDSMCLCTVAPRCKTPPPFRLAASTTRSRS
jgi:hypothetical protein